MKTTGTSQREHHWDAMRGLLMLLGIPYHVALAYQLGDGKGQAWIVNAHEGAAGLATFAQFLHLFRMPAFFIVAGYFAALLLSRRPPVQWLSGRFERLGIPFLAALLLLNPLVNLACELSNFALVPALQSLLDNSATSGGYWIRHLWFLIVLLYFCTAAALLARRFPSLRTAMLPARADHWLARHFVPSVLMLAVLVGLWEAVSIELFYMAGLATNGPQQIVRLDETLQFAPWFLIGCVLARAPALRERLYRPSLPIALMAVASCAVSLVFMGKMGPMTGRFADSVAAVMLTQCIIALCRHFARRAHPLTDRLVDASFAIYLVHLPVIVWLVVAAQPLAMPVMAKAALVMAAALVLSWLAAALILRVPVLRLLFDGRRSGAPGGILTPPSRDRYRDRPRDLRPSLP